MAHHEHGDAPALEGLEDHGKDLLEFRVQPLGRLVQEQDFRVQKQHFRQGRPLLLTSGEVVGVPIQQLLQAAELHRSRYPVLLVFLFQLHAPEDLKQILPDRFLHKQCLRILWQGAYPAVQLDFASVGLLQATNQGKGSGLAGAVAAHEGQEFAFLHSEAYALHHVWQVLVVFEPNVLQGDGSFL